jgi:hypothetical protein
MAYGRSTGGRMGGKGGHGFSLKTDMSDSGMSRTKMGQKKPFGKSGGSGVRGSQMGKGKARKQARAKV